MAHTSRSPSGSEPPLPSFDLSSPIAAKQDEVDDEAKTKVGRAAGSLPPTPPGSLLASTLPPAPRVPNLGRAAAGSATATPLERWKRWVSASSSLDWARRAEDALIERLPLDLRGRVQRRRPLLRWGAGATIAALVLGLGLGLARLSRPRTAESAKSVASTDSPAEPATTAAAPAETTAAPAAATGTPAATSAPARDEASVLLDYAASLLAEHRSAAVPPLLARLIARHPELKDDARLKQVLLTTAASNDVRAASDSFALLTGPMGESGAALVYELSLKPEVPSAVQKRAERWLGSKDFERISALPVFAAEKLRRAKSCEDKHALLDFAAQAGGPYVLAYLKELATKTSCGPDDLDHCYACLASDDRLSQAIRRLEAR